MAQNQDLRKQSSTPTTPTDTDKVVLYANASGQIAVVNSDGTVLSVGGQFVQNIGMAGVTVTATGVTNIIAGTPFTISGNFYGSTGVAGTLSNKPVFLAAPTHWLIAVGPSGESLAIPSYTYA